MPDETSDGGFGSVRIIANLGGPGVGLVALIVATIVSGT